MRRGCGRQPRPFVSVAAPQRAHSGSGVWSRLWRPGRLPGLSCTQLQKTPGSGQWASFPHPKLSESGLAVLDFALGDARREIRGPSRG